MIASLIFHTKIFGKIKASSSSSDGKMCTLMGCGPNSVIFFDASLSFEELIKSRIQFCQNFKCSTVTFDNIKEVPKPYSGWGGMSDSGRAEASVMADKNGRLFIELHFYGRGFFGKSIGRDRYSAALINSEGKTVSDLRKWMDYKISHPNGKDCGPTCYSSIFDERKQTVPWH